MKPDTTHRITRAELLLYAATLAFTLAVAGLLRRFALPGFSGEALALVSAQLRREAERDGPLRLTH